MDKIYFGIISYHRPECKTYYTLKKMGIQDENILISLNDTNDYEIYKESLPKTVNIFCRKGNNAAANRNNILDYFSEGTKVVIVDDDISAIMKWEYDGKDKYGKLKPISKEILTEVLEDCFIKTTKVGNNKFGIYSTTNTMMIKSTIQGQGIYSVNKVFQGCFFGFIVDKIERFDETMPVLDDYERVLKDIYNGKTLLRRNDLVVKVAKLGSNKGGCKDAYDNGAQKQALDTLAIRYGKIMKIKKNYTGIILKKGV